MNFLKNFNVQVTGAVILAILSYFGYQQYIAVPPSDPTVAVITPATTSEAAPATEEAAPAATEEPATATDAAPTTTDEEEVPAETTTDAK